MNEEAVHVENEQERAGNSRTRKTLDSLTHEDSANMHVSSISSQEQR